VNRYLLDTNHLSAYLDRHAQLESRIDSALLAGDRFGIVLPVLCEYRAGIALGSRYQRNFVRLQAALSIFVYGRSTRRPPPNSQPYFASCGWLDGSCHSLIWSSPPRRGTRGKPF
jgi:hypothetical protein